MIKNDEKFLERLRLAIDKIGGNDSAAKVMGKSPKSIERYKAGADPSFNDVRSLTMAAGLNIEWLAFGEGSSGVSGFGDSSQEEFYVPKNQLVNIPVMNVSASAGNGRLITEEEADGYIQFNQQWLHEMRLSKADLFTIPTVGESMEPTIKAGEYLLCSRSERHTQVGDGIYVIRLDGNILVKRLQVLPGGILEVSSDNSMYYKPFKLTISKQVDFQVLGKVILVHGIRWL